MKKLLGVYCGIVAATAVLSAQTPSTPATSSAQTTTTRQSSQPVTITGCVSPDLTSNPSAATAANQRFILSNVQPSAGASTAAQGTTVTTYILAPGADVNLGQQLNHKVEITGTIDSSSTTTNTTSSSTSPSATSAPTTTRSTTQSTSATMPTFRVTSVKMLSETCP